MDFIRNSYSKQTTLVLSGSTPGVSMLFPDATDGLRAGQLPQIVGGSGWARNDASVDGPGENNATIAPNTPASATPAPRGGGR
jgi:hypothetical protein